MNGDQNWLPLESNPDVINDYVQKLGFSTDNYQFHELLAFEEWALEMVPQPVVGGLLLFPITEKIQDFEKNETAAQNYPQSLFFMKQFAQNACGTVGLLHLLSNLPENLAAEISPDSYLAKFIVATKDLTPEEAGKYMKNEESLQTIHKEAVEHGQSEVNEEVSTHFIAFVQKEGKLYELDGRKEGPIDHGPTSNESFSNDIITVVKNFMARDPEEVRFSVTLLGPSP